MKNPLSPSSSSQNTKSTLPPQQSSSKRRLPRWVVFVLVGVVIVMGVIVIYNMMSGGSMNIGESVEQRKMEEYLEEKYGEEFVVKEPSRKASGIGIEGVLSAKAYPRKDENLQFIVAYTSQTGYYDYYPSAIWSREESNKVNKIWDNDVNIAVIVNATSNILHSLRKVPPYKEASLQFSSDISYIIEATRNTKETTVKESDINLIKAFVEHVNEQPVKQRAVIYTIQKFHNNQGLRCELSNNRDKIVFNLDNIKGCFKDL